MIDIEIPYQQDRGFRYRFFEILPGAISWTLLLLPFILGFFSVTAASIYILGYTLIYFVRAMVVAVRTLQGYRVVSKYQKYDWEALLEELEAGTTGHGHTRRPKWHENNLLRLQTRQAPIQPSELLHVVMIATYNESREVLAPTIEAILGADYDMQQVMLVIAYEERGGSDVAARANELVKTYGARFRHAMAVQHPKDIKGELIGKGGNITYAGREVQKYLAQHDVEPLKTIVTTLDADNKPHKQYLASLSYTYCVAEDPVHISYQPTTIYSNNIWDVPAPMRVVAVGNSFSQLVMALRPHMMRNFSAHAQSLQALIDTNFWSVRTIVEDGHQFWRTYFRYDGRHESVPVYVPIYQDAVLSDTYWKTLKAQFLQLRRWTWGVSDVAFFIDKAFFHKNRIPLSDRIAKLGRLSEGHITWAVGPLLIAYSALIPVLFHPQSYVANALPLIVSKVNTAALIGLAATLFVSFKMLPPKPARYKRRRTFWMLLQWIYMPATSIIYNALAALYSQTRLMFGKYLGFDVTAKTVVLETGEKVASKPDGSSSHHSHSNA
jgi:hypothetical protein